jgi:drug/metabolite transporter (DMT)-like permease
MGAIQAAVATQVGAFSDWHVPAAILWTGIVTTALTAFGENMAMQSLSAAESTVIFSTEPLWGTAFAAVVLGEQVNYSSVHMCTVLYYGTVYFIGIHFI